MQAGEKERFSLITRFSMLHVMVRNCTREFSCFQKRINMLESPCL